MAVSAIRLALTVLILLTATARNAAIANETQYTSPKEIRWMPQTTEGVSQSFFIAYLRGKQSDKCGQLMRIKFPDHFVYPWHVNNQYSIDTILQGTLVIGFDKHHLASAERMLPAGSVVQGLATEPHYGRAIGETIFDAYFPCGVR